MTKRDTAIDTDGTVMPWSSDRVRAHVWRMLERGEVLAAIVEADGEIAVQCFGPPSEKLLDVLEAVTRGYRQALRRDLPPSERPS